MKKYPLLASVSLLAIVFAPAAFGQTTPPTSDENLASILQRLERLEAENKAYKSRLQEIELDLEAPAIELADKAVQPITLASSSDGNSGLIQFNHKYAYDMLDPTTNINTKQLYLLEQKRDGVLDKNTVYIGGAVTAIADYWDSNTDDKFGYLMRHPTANNQIGDTVSEAVIHSAQTNFTANIGDWVTAYGEFLYDPQQSFGTGTVTDLNRNQIQLRQGYVLFGNLEKTPFYGAIGKMSTPFGLTDTVNPFSASTNWRRAG